MKIAVVGAGPAGLSFTYSLLSMSNKHEVTIYEMDENITGKCAGGIGIFWLRKVIDKVPIPNEFVQSYINRVIINGFDFKFPRWVGIIIDRDGWQKWLFKQVIDMGAVCIIKPFEIEYTKRYDLVVCADGGTSRLRQIITGAKLKPSDIWITGQVEVEKIDKIENAIVMKFHRYGYTWAFDAGDIAKLGLGIRNGDGNIVELLHELTKGFEVKKEYYKPLVLTKPLDKLIYGKFVFIGDAALLCNPLTGGGIGPAILSAHELAKAIVEGDLNKYRIRVMRWKMKINYAVRELLAKFVKNPPITSVKKMREFLLG